MKFKKATEKEDFKILEDIYNKRIREFIKLKSKNFKELKEKIKKDFKEKGLEYNPNFGECTIGTRFLKIGDEESYKSLIDYYLSDDIFIGKRFVYDFVKSKKFIIKKELIKKLEKLIKSKIKNLDKLSSIERKFFDLLLEK